jgi:hypothetical protein
MVKVTLDPGRDTWELRPYFQSWVLGALRDDEAAAWRTAGGEAEADGTPAWAPGARSPSSPRSDASPPASLPSARRRARVPTTSASSA